MGLNNFILNCEKDNEGLREDIKYYKNYNQRLSKENQELKKQLEEYQNLIKNLKQLELYEYNLDYDYEENPIDDYQSFDMDYYIDNYLKIGILNEEETKNKRKEFINYLEEYITEEENSPKYDCVFTDAEVKDVVVGNLCFVLSKYKEIIGDNNE